MKRSGIIVTTWLVLVGAGCGAPPAEAPCGDCDVSFSQRAATATIFPFADAYVRDGTSASTNFGTLTTLEVKAQSTAGNNRYAYLRFPLGSVSGTVTSAKLRLFGKRPSANTVTNSAYGVDDDGWGETSLNWNNKPPLGPKQSSVVVGTASQYYEWDVTSYVTAQKNAAESLVSFAVKMDTNVTIGPDVFNTREASSGQPQLVVTSAVSSQPPTVATPAAASPNPINGAATTAVSVLGADDGGEAALVYTWSGTSGPAPVAFSPNGTNAAKNSTATFTMAGDYDLQVVIRDAGSLTVTSSVHVTVNRGVAHLVLSPAAATIPPRAAQQFTVRARDQFNLDMTPIPALTWSVSGGGTVNAAGVFTAGTTVGGPFTVTATCGGASGSAQISISSTTSTVHLQANADAHVRDGTSANTNFGTAAKLEVKAQSTAGNNRIAYVRFPLTGVAAVVSAKLRLFGNRPSANTVSNTAVGVPDTFWSETAITWNNRPAPIGAQSAGVVVGTPAQYYEWDVTEHVKAMKDLGQTDVTLAVKMDSNVTIGPDSFNARESTSNRPELVVISGPCSEVDGCACERGAAGGDCAACAQGFQRDMTSGRCVLINDGTFTEWPNAVSKLSSDPWLVVHHDEIQVVKPRVLVLIYGNDRTRDNEALRDKVVAGFAEGSKTQGFANPTATAQWQYQIDKTIDLRDNSGKPNSLLLPRKAPDGAGHVPLDYKVFFSAAYASHYGYPNPDQPGQFLDLCTLVNRGIIHEMWFMADQVDTDASPAEVLGMQPFYTVTGNRTSRMNMCAGNGCFDSDVPSCGRTMRIGFINNTRGPGCNMHGQGHGIEEGLIYSLPALNEWFRPFASFDLDTRYGLPFPHMRAAGCPSTGNCFEYLSTTRARFPTAGNREIDPFDPVCGNVHFPPNGVHDYDYENPQFVSSSCIGFGRHQGAGGADAQQLIGKDQWKPRFDNWDDCGGEFMVWWYQNMPGFNSGQTFSDGRRMQSMWPFWYY